MEDHGVGRLLRELPRETARPGFTRRVLARLDEPAEAPARRGGWWSLRYAMAAVAIVLVVAAGWVRVERSREAAKTAEARRILQEIRAEHDRLERELNALSEPLYVGGDEQMDLVVDLDKVPAEAGPVPAAFRSDTF